MSPCGASRVLLPGFVVGVLVSTLLGNDALAWVAAALTIAATAVVQRLRGRTTSCALPSAPADRDASAERIAP